MRITDLSSEKKYFTQIPNIIFEIGLKPAELAVYMAIKRAAGDCGSCTKSLGTLCKAAGVDIKTLRLIKKTLAQPFPIINKPLIEVSIRFSELGDQTTDEITIVDIWEESLKYFMGVVPKTVGGGGTKNGGGVVPKTVPKEEPLKEEPYLTTPKPPPSPPNCAKSDLPLKGGGAKKYFYLDKAGRTQQVDESLVFRHFARHAYPTETVITALESLKLDKPIGDLLKYLESICSRLVSEKPRKIVEEKPMGMLDLLKQLGKEEFKKRFPNILIHDENTKMQQGIFT